jgi:regulator of protease activity HflC (stomatin/prohibitin superfamily)
MSSFARVAVQTTKWSHNVLALHSRHCGNPLFHRLASRAAAVRARRQFLLGKFEGVRGPGLTLIFIPIQQMVRVSLRTVTMQIPSQKIITKDNVSIDIAAVAYYHISDPEKAVIAIENVYNAINQISQTTVRNVVGRFSLDQLLSDTASINEQIKNVIDGHTEPWGTQVTAVEIKDIVLPDNMQRAMAKEAEAERERRAKIVAAEGEYQAAVKLGEAADIITQHPVALQLRTLQTMAEISVEKNSTIIFPAQFMTTVQEAIALLSKDSASKKLRNTFSHRTLGFTCPYSKTPKR